MAKWPRNSGSPALSASWAAAFADASLHPQGARTERLAPVQSSGLGARLRMDRLLNDLSFGLVFREAKTQLWPEDRLRLRAASAYRFRHVPRACVYNIRSAERPI
jgi:hypothetical protein